MSRRRPHKKSRLGCGECKRRHVKCDEARPTCRNCLALDRSCVYPPIPSHAQRSSSAPTTRPSLPESSEDGSCMQIATTPSTVSVRLTAHTSNPPTLAPTPESPYLDTTSPAQYGALHPPLNIRHMELLSNFFLETTPSLAQGQQLDPAFLRATMPIALSAPYLMHQILALSAMHLCHARPALATYYHEEATALQTHALTLLNDSPVEINTENCAPMLIFTSFLGLHALAEAVATSECDADGFLDRYVSYSNLHRGVRTITERSWKVLLQSDLSPILRQSERSLSTASSHMQERAKTVADRLHRLLDDADMSASSEKACRDAVSHLELVYKTETSFEESVPEDCQSVGLIWAWPSLLSGNFTDLLLRRTPEALIILCHYAVLLHQHRDLWLVKSAGRMLIEAVTRFLGTYWKDWLEWPNLMIS